MKRKYLVRWDYVSSWGGPWSASEEIELEEEHAAAVNRDSPGVLFLQEDDESTDPAPAEQAATEPTEVESPEAAVATQRDRMARRARHRGQGGPQEPIDGTVFKATKSG